MRLFYHFSLNLHTELVGVFGYYRPAIPQIQIDHIDHTIMKKIEKMVLFRGEEESFPARSADQV